MDPQEVAETLNCRITAAHAFAQAYPVIGIDGKIRELFDVTCPRTHLDAITVTEADVSALGDVPRSETDSRAAVGRIESPALRIIDRLFWLHSLGVTTSDDNSLKKHDLALMALFDALSGNLDEECAWKWARVLN
jgi:hypothetical protein